MSDFVPSTVVVRTRYVDYNIEEVPFWMRDTNDKIRGEEFDRWLEETKREARAEAWAEAINHVEPYLGQTVKRAAHADNPYEG